jgi:hypothetical protein
MGTGQGRLAGGLDIFNLGIGWGQRVLAGLSSFFDWRHSDLFCQLVNFLIGLVDGLVSCPFRTDPYCDRWMMQNLQDCLKEVLNEYTTHT